MTKKIPHTTQIHGDTIVDDYFWLREKTNPQVMAHLHAEDDYALSVMQPTMALQNTLYKELLSHLKQTDVNVPYRQGDYFYYSRTEEGQQYPIYCRKKRVLTAPEEVVLDQNVLAQWQNCMSLSEFSPSDDGKLLGLLD